MTATQLHTTAEAGEILGVTSVTVWRWINAGRLRAVDLAMATERKPKLRIRDDDLQQFIEDRTLEQSA